MVVRPFTAEDFDELVMLPENLEKNFEFIGGEIVEVPSNPYSSYIAGFIYAPLFMHVLANDLGFVTGENGGYMVAGERYAPDVAFLAKARQTELVRTGYNPLPPDLAVEVVSPTDRETPLLNKVVNYLSAGTEVWVVYPEDKVIHVYLPGQPVTTLKQTDTLEGTGALTGFKLPLKDIFREN